MNVNGIAKQAYYDNNSGAKVNNKNNGSTFHDSLTENINNKNESVQKNVAAPMAAMAAKSYAYRNVISADNYDNEIATISSITVCDARQLTYQDSDYVKVFPEQGYSLAAKVDVENRSIYIEKKAEDGSVNGYVVELDKIADGTKNPIEQAALEAWGKVELEKSAAVAKAERGQDASQNDNEEEQTFEEALAQFYDFVEDRIKNGDIKYVIGNNEFSLEEWEKFLASLDKQIDDIIEDTRERAEKVKNQYIDADKIAGLNDEQLKEQALQKWRDDPYASVPYGYLAKNGVIEYKGVVFVCDTKHNAIHLGDTSDSSKCIRIPLSKGGSLIVNRDNLGDLAKAIGMFSPEDVNLIMRAIAEDAKVQQMKKQIDDVTSGEELAEEIAEEEETEDDILI